MKEHMTKIEIIHLYYETRDKEASATHLVHKTRAVEAFADKILDHLTAEQELTVREVSDEKREYRISIHGCDDSTEWMAFLTEHEKQVIENLELKSKEVSTYACMPIIELTNSLKS